MREPQFAEVGKGSHEGSYGTIGDRLAVVQVDLKDSRAVPSKRCNRPVRNLYNTVKFHLIHT